MHDTKQKYLMVYSHLWQTFGSTWEVRLSYQLQFVGRICKLIALPVALSLIITRLSQADYAGARQAIVLFVVASALLGILSPVVRYVGMLGEGKTYDKITGNYFSKLTSADLDYFNSNLSGYLTTATRQYADSSVQLIRNLRSRYMNTILSVIFPLGVILYLDRPLGFVTLALIVINVAYILWASKVITPLRTKTREIYKRNSGRMADIISNILAVKSTAQEDHYVERTKLGARMEAAEFKKRYGIQAKLIAFREAITVLVFAILFTMTTSRLSDGSITLTTAILVITYATTILTGIYTLGDDLDEHDDTVDRIIPAFEILERENIVKDPAHPVRLNDQRSDIEFKDISFSYEKADRHRVVFKSFSVVIPDGQKVGIVGISGAGKSTFTKLLLRFNDPDSGSVLLGGIDVRTVRQNDLRRKIAYIPQEPMLLHASIKENILLARPSASDEDVASALTAAHAADFVARLPEGLGSVVGERGVKLSGGQKQRIVIARAVLQGAPVMVLDEATSALDSESEHIIQDSLKDILKGKTAILIAHRLSTLANVDRIIVIEAGELVEDGNHDQLMKQAGRYAELWNRQHAQGLI